MIMQRRTLHRNQKRSGTAIVETAVMLPVLLAVTFGVVEFGRALMVINLMTNAAREGARRAIIKGISTSDVKTLVIDQIHDTVGATITANNVSVDVTPYTGNPDPNDECLNASTRDLVEIQVTVPYNDVGYFFRYLANINLRAQAAMRHE